MAKEKEHAGAGKKAGGKKRLHLREVRTRQAADGSLVHHHTYADSADSMHEHPERMNMATSASPEEAGQHVQEMFSQNAMAGQEPEPGAGAPGAEGEPQGA